MIILGVDPGTRRTGYAVVESRPNGFAALTAGCLELGAYNDHAVRLQKIWSKITSLLREFRPEAAAIEAPFCGQNPASALKLGRAQGVAMAAAMHRRVPVFEYAPREIKRTVTGDGGASKQRVARMALSFLNQGGLCAPETLGADAFDALAVALTHAVRVQSPHASPPPTASKKSDWSEFVRRNPDRVK
ncbi:MAG: crossover junction endodeoxyribonuclease RuvC [Bacteroidia bacterium]|nr:crossover junction endodeoxyribonuclease RuvC [Bacteroidia bacterium]MDW8334362.1 crossover junction endodeoxyribonuclease RuvC [Bacteroidia bacterium]